MTKSQKKISYSEPSVIPKKQVVVFSLDDQWFGLNLDFVERVLLAVEITPLPGAPDFVLGVISLHGQMIPVLNLRQRFHFPDREVQLTDCLLIVKKSQRAVAVMGDGLIGVSECAGPDPDNGMTLGPSLSFVQEVVEVDQRMVLVPDLDRLVSPEDARILDVTLDENRNTVI